MVGRNICLGSSQIASHLLLSHLATLLTLSSSPPAASPRRRSCGWRRRPPSKVDASRWTATRTSETTDAVVPQPRRSNSASHMATKSTAETAKCALVPGKAAVGELENAGAALECVRGEMSVTTSVRMEMYSASLSSSGPVLPRSEKAEAGIGASRRSTVGSTNWRSVLSSLWRPGRGSTQRTCELAARRRTDEAVPVTTCTPTLAGRPMATSDAASRRSMLASGVKPRYH